MADWWLYIFIFLLGFLLIRGLHLTNQAQKPTLQYQKNSQYVQRVLELCPLFSKVYTPPKLWGMSGHLQTLIYSWLGRMEPPMPHGRRVMSRMHDGASATFDVFERLQAHPTEGDYTIVICPGIGNSSETCYIRTMIDFCQRSGFRVAVHNHLGALRDVKLTAPRIFTYGETGELATMVRRVREMYPHTTMIACGLSMGANLILKYLGEDKKNQDEFIGVISACQGYDIMRCMIGRPERTRLAASWPWSLSNGALTLSWDHLRRVYNYAMTRGQLNFIGRHHDALFGGENAGRYDVEEIYASSCLQELDERYTRRRAGFPSLEEYYEWCSCNNYMFNIELPMFVLNARDDPLVPPELYDTPARYVQTNDKSVFVVTKHGGHLGFFEPRHDNHFMAHPITWLDKVVIEYVNALITITADQSGPAKQTSAANGNMVQTSVTPSVTS